MTTLGPEVFADRRRRLMERIGPKAAALFFSAPESVRSNDSHFDYRQNSDLYYLTGFEEPDAALLLLPGHDKHPVVMFVRKRDKEREIWDGARAGAEGAKERYGANEAFLSTEVDEKLAGLLDGGRERLLYSLGHSPSRDAQVIRAVGKMPGSGRRVKKGPRIVVDPERDLHELRLYKTGAELEALKRAIRVSAEAHVRAMKATKPGCFEYEIQAEIEYAFKKHGAKAPGYATIVGSGPNACVLHYIENRREMNAGELLLVDAGAEVDYYTGDITRTWPVSGRFDGPQREIYDLVLQAQEEIISMVKPGLAYNVMHERTIEILTRGMVDRGILEGTVEKAIEDKTFRRFYMHGTGHWLGMDVHDVGAYSLNGEKGRVLEPGMVFTVEPGLYFHPDTEKCPERYKNIGVRIEDDILVTETGYEVLSKDAPKQPDDLEAIVGSGV